MRLTTGIVLGHHVSSTSIKVDPAKIYVIAKLETSISQKDIRSCLGHVGY